MYKEILITELNDFIFCPASIYFHKMYGSRKNKESDLFPEFDMLAKDIKLPDDEDIQYDNCEL